MASYEPGRIYICLNHPHSGHYYLTPKGNWRFYNSKRMTWYKETPDIDNCTLILFEDPQ